MKWRVYINGVPAGTHNLATFGIGDTIFVKGVAVRVISYTQNPRELWTVRV